MQKELTAAYTASYMHRTCRTGRSRSACWGSARTNKKAHNLLYSQAGVGLLGNQKAAERGRCLPCTPPACTGPVRGGGIWERGLSTLQRGPQFTSYDVLVLFNFSATYFLLFHVCLPMALPLSLECSVRFWELLLMPPPTLSSSFPLNPWSSVPPRLTPPLYPLHPVFYSVLL